MAGDGRGAGRSNAHLRRSGPRASSRSRGVLNWSSGLRAPLACRSASSASASASRRPHAHTTSTYAARAAATRTATLAPPNPAQHAESNS